MTDTATAALTPTSQLPGVAPGAQLWDVGGRVYVVFQVRGQDRFYGWHVTDLTQLGAFGGAEAITRRLTPEEAAATRFTSFGVRSSLIQFAQDPEEAFTTELERQMRVLPMLADSEVRARAWGAFLEGRSLGIADIADTGYWTTRTPRQREWETFVLQQGGMEAAAVQERLTDARLVVRDALIESGWQGTPPGSLAAFLADRFTTGQWSQTRLQDEVLRHTDPTHPNASPFAGRGLPPDAALVTDGARFYVRTGGGDFLVTGEGQLAQLGGGETAEKVEGAIDEAGTFGDLIAQTDLFDPADPSDPFGGRSGLGGEEDVWGLMLHWVGPRIASLYDDDWIRHWAGRIRRNPEEVDVLIDTLRAARQEQFPHWSPELAYADRAPFYRQLYAQHAGFLPEEANDDFFMSLMQRQDQGQVVQMLRDKGTVEHWEPIMLEVYGGLLDATGGQIREAV